MRFQVGCQKLAEQSDGVVEQTSLNLLQLCKQNTLAQTDDASDGGLHAQTDGDASFLISQIGTLCQSLPFTFLLNPSTVRSTSSFSESGEEWCCVVVSVVNKG